MGTNQIYIRHNCLKVSKKSVVHTICIVYLYGFHVKTKNDTDLSIFWDKENVSDFEEDAVLFNLIEDLDLRVESFFKKDFEDRGPFIQETITTGKGFYKELISYENLFNYN